MLEETTAKVLCLSHIERHVRFAVEEIDAGAVRRQPCRLLKDGVNACVDHAIDILKPDR